MIGEMGPATLEGFQNRLLSARWKLKLPEEASAPGEGKGSPSSCGRPLSGPPVAAIRLGPARLEEGCGCVGGIQSDAVRYDTGNFM